MASFYLDHDVSLGLAPLLRAAGHTSTTARDVGLAQATDDEQLLTAAQHGQIFLMHNRKDYILLNDAWSRAWDVPAPPHARILGLVHRPEPELAAAVGAFLAAAPAVPLTNALYWWRYRLGWHSRLPDPRWVPYP